MRDRLFLGQRSASSEAEVAAASRLQELRERLERNDLVVALKSPESRRVLFRVLDVCGVFADVTTDDPLELQRRVGRQSIGRYLWAAIDDIDDSAVWQMRLEARARARRDADMLESARLDSTEEQ